VPVSSTGAAAGRLEEDDVITAIEGMATITRPGLSEIMTGFGPGDGGSVLSSGSGPVGWLWGWGGRGHGSDHRSFPAATLWFLTGEAPMTIFALSFIIPTGIAAWFLLPVALRPEPRGEMPRLPGQSP
jgi:hypothetical protein